MQSIHETFPFFGTGSFIWLCWDGLKTGVGNETVAVENCWTPTSLHFSYFHLILKKNIIQKCNKTSCYIVAWSRLTFWLKLVHRQPEISGWIQAIMQKILLFQDSHQYWCSHSPHLGSEWISWSIFLHYHHTVFAKVENHDKQNVLLWKSQTIHKGDATSRFGHPTVFEIDSKCGILGFSEISQNFSSFRQFFS